MQEAGPSPVPPSVSGDDDTDANGRKRRRRGRRGGRGRRRGGAEDGSDQDQLNDTPIAVNGAEPSRAAAAAELMPAPVAMAAVPAPVAPRPHESESVPVMRAAEPVSAPAPVDEPAYASSAEAVAPSEPREHHEPHEHRERREPREGRRERPRPERSAEGGEGGSSTPDMSSDELAATSKRLTEELLRHMGFEPTVTARAEGNRVDVTAEVDRDDHLLTGRQGETLQSLQHLLNRFLNKGDGSRYHLQLEVNDHWQKRELELEAMAKKFADDAIAQNAEIVSDYLNSQERRILHVTLKEDRRVRTFSLGMGMVKRVAVAPASFPERTEDDSVS